MLRKNRYSTIIIMAIICGLAFQSLGSAALALDLKGEADYLPWSGWWWPKSKGQLVLGYNGRPSPAEKYDLYTTGKYPGNAYREGLKEWYDPNAISWIGYCNGWVNSSILEAEPILPASRNGVFLSVGDKKGLLAACHFEDEIIYEYCSQSPEPFHRYLINYIGEQGEIIGADLDSSESFWSYPIYSYEMAVTSGSDSDLVTCTIKHAEDLVGPDYQGTLEQSRTYRYRLFKEVDGSYNGGGEWLQGDPDDLHPQSVWVPVGGSQNQLFVDYDKVENLVRTRDDEMEGMELVPGHHLLVVYPGEDDSFTLNPQPGEDIRCSLALDPQSAAGNGASFRIERNNEIESAAVLDSELQQINLSSDSGLDELRLTILPDPDNSAGVCVHLYVDVQAQYQSWFYGFPGASYWLGCAVTSINDNEKVWLEIVGDQGLPLGRGEFSGESLKQGGQWLKAIENNLTVDYFNGDAEPIAFKLVSSTPFQSLLLAGDSFTLRGPPESTAVLGSKLVIPWLTSDFNMRQSVTFHLANPGDTTLDTTISYIKNDGTLVRAVALEVAPETIEEYGSGDYHEQRSGVDGWGLIESSGSGFSGDAVLREGYSLADQLPLIKPSRSWIAPHLATDLGWQTRLGLCNPNPNPLTMTINALIDGEPTESYTIVMEPFVKTELEISSSLFGVDEEEMNQAWLYLSGDLDTAAYLQFRYGAGIAASIPLYEDVSGESTRKLAQLAVSGGWWTGIVLLNRSSEAVAVELSAFNNKGELLQRLPLNIGAKGKFSASVAALFNGVDCNQLASLRLVGGAEIKAMALYGGIDGFTHLSAHNW